MRKNLILSPGQATTCTVISPAISLPRPPAMTHANPNMEFIGWYINDTGAPITSIATGICHENLSVTARWKCDNRSYNDPINGCTGCPSGANADEGATKPADCYLGGTAILTDHNCYTHNPPGCDCSGGKCVRRMTLNEIFGEIRPSFEGGPANVCYYNPPKETGGPP